MMARPGRSTPFPMVPLHWNHRDSGAEGSILADASRRPGARRPGAATKP